MCLAHKEKRVSALVTCQPSRRILAKTRLHQIYRHLQETDRLLTASYHKQSCTQTIQTRRDNTFPRRSSYGSIPDQVRGLQSRYRSDKAHEK